MDGEEKQNTKIKVVRLYWEWTETDGCQQIEEESIK